MDVRPGYKRIPDSWEVRCLKEDILLISGRHVLSQHYNEQGNGIPYLTGPADFPNGYIRQTKFTPNPAVCCEPGDILVTVKGSGAGTLIEADASYCISRQLMAIRVRAWNGKFLFYSLLQNASRIKAASTGLIPGLSRTDILDQPIPLPLNPAEQEAIAGALSDADALIESLEQLLIKKRQVKQGAMQELLTGRKRLPGFSGAWRVKKVGELGEVITGGTPPTQIKEYWQGTIPWVTPTDIGQTKDVFSTERQLTSRGLETIRELPPNSVLVTCIASIGKNAVLRINGGCNQQINAIVPTHANYADFLYYLFDSSKQYLLSNAGMTATSIISKKDFSELNFRVPQLDEQQAIATILSDIDSEIDALREKLDKARQIKYGMMQELLTGRIRLV